MRHGIRVLTLITPKYIYATNPNTKGYAKKKKKKTIFKKKKKEKNPKQKGKAKKKKNPLS